MSRRLHTARARSLFVERIVWVMVRHDRWVIVLIPHHGDRLLCAFRNGVRML